MRHLFYLTKIVSPLSNHIIRFQILAIRHKISKLRIFSLLDALSTDLFNIPTKKFRVFRNDRKLWSY